MDPLRRLLSIEQLICFDALLLQALYGYSVLQGVSKTSPVGIFINFFWGNIWTRKSALYECKGDNGRPFLLMANQLTY